MNGSDIDAVLIPQAVGKTRGKKVQYHSQVDKEVGLGIYQAFVAAVREQVPTAHVECGTYGNTQGLRLTAVGGPLTHTFEWQ